ncbi:hypothetical protein MKX50_10625 [Paenibacillus sp. FSL W8-0186]|uniref:Uncharacterized protein n=1 Tax=Paenibacillus woosongensis TaxID=307580 RepID=A0ABQ4MKV4_9BACL|nr:hypothetical protein [Paenibacillus woosongensis]GIP56613.1 hypothetical protein J15TS10_04270 [Paenibacillus woosongensis]
MSMRHIRKLLEKGFLAAILAIGGYAAAAETTVAYQEPTPIPQASPEGGKEQQQPRHHHKGHFRGGHIVKDTAELLGVEPKVLIEDLKQGKSLLQVVQARKGWSEAEYVQKLTAVVTGHIDKAAAEGRLSPEKAATMKMELPVKLKKIVNRTWKSSSKEHPVTDYRSNNTILWHKAD